jgi:hypothetical protein
MSDRKLDLGNVMEQALRPSPTKVPRPLEQRVEQLETLLREVVEAYEAAMGSSDFVSTNRLEEAIVATNELLTN